MKTELQAFYLHCQGGARFCVYHQPRGPVRGSVLYLHPLADEMNKSRRMAALQSRSLAGAGYAVLQIDLQGCGDSPGDFVDASWSTWLGDVIAASRWLRAQHNAPLTLWGLRTGCLLASAAASQLPEPAALLLWQPTPSGRVALQQLLRIRLAASLQSGAGKESVEQLRQRLAAGHSVEVAGYALGAGVALGLDQATLVAPAAGQRVLWLEVAARAGAAVLPASAQCLESWRASGVEVHDRVVEGAAFWQSVDIEEVPALLDATLGLLEGVPA